jgi:hypothetical protein
MVFNSRLPKTLRRRVFGLLAGIQMVEPGVVGRIRVLGSMPEARRRHVFIGISAAVNLAFLGFFNYSNFFVDSANTS